MTSRDDARADAERAEYYAEKMIEAYGKEINHLEWLCKDAAGRLRDWAAAIGRTIEANPHRGFGVLESLKERQERYVKLAATLDPGD